MTAITQNTNFLGECSDGDGEDKKSQRLCDKWNLYYHLPNDKNWDISSYKMVKANIATVEDLIRINEGIPESIVKYCMLFVMRKGIAPMWEDPKNRNGGCFSFKIINKQVPYVWKSLFYALCGETLIEGCAGVVGVNGITISPKKNFCIIKVWLDSCDIQDPGKLCIIPGLSKQGCLFKKHAPEF